MNTHTHTCHVNIVAYYRSKKHHQKLKKLIHLSDSTISCIRFYRFFFSFVRLLAVVLLAVCHTIPRKLLLFLWSIEEEEGQNNTHTHISTTLNQQIDEIGYFSLSFYFMQSKWYRIQSLRFGYDLVFVWIKSKVREEEFGGAIRQIAYTAMPHNIQSENWNEWEMKETSTYSLPICVRTNESLHLHQTHTHTRQHTRTFIIHYMHACNSSLITIKHRFRAIPFRSLVGCVYMCPCLSVRVLLDKRVQKPKVRERERESKRKMRRSKTLQLDIINFRRNIKINKFKAQNFP